MADVSYVFGLHAVMALFRNPHRQIMAVYMNQERQDKRMQQIMSQASARNVPIEWYSIDLMDQRFANFNHQGVVACASPLPDYDECDIPHLLAANDQPCFVLILDGVTDPHNLGACLRSADAAGVDFVMIPKDKNASITPIVSKVACGAAESVPLLRVTNLVRGIEKLKQAGVWVYGAAGEAQTSIYQVDCKAPIAMVLGAEDKGIRRLTRVHCDGLFSLPMLGSVSSLNVSVAAGIVLYEAVRQRVC